VEEARTRPSHVGGVVIHDDAAVENEVCIMNDAALAESVDGLQMTSAVNNNMMTPAARFGSRMLLMTLISARTSRRHAPLAIPSVAPPRAR
jgi:hypothetical protein